LKKLEIFKGAFLVARQKSTGLGGMLDLQQEPFNLACDTADSLPVFYVTYTAFIYISV
jgi:hypothetical protein